MLLFNFNCIEQSQQEVTLQRIAFTQKGTQLLMKSHFRAFLSMQVKLLFENKAKTIYIINHIYASPYTQVYMMMRYVEIVR